jgi:signal transduction histidine kinase
VLILESNSLNKETHEMAFEFDKTVNGVFSLLENLLQWSRSQSGGMDFTPESFDLLVLVESNRQLLHEHAKSKGIDIECRFPQTPLLVYSHKESISAVIRNLISNALKFTKTGGAITIETRLNDQEVTLSVVDNGVGIPHESLHNLFNIGYNKSTLGTSFEEGTGLGLILCKEFIEKNGGKIWAQSEVGKGSVFQFTIPVRR